MELCGVGLDRRALELKLKVGRGLFRGSDLNFDRFEFTRFTIGKLLPGRGSGYFRGGRGRLRKLFDGSPRRLRLLPPLPNIPLGVISKALRISESIEAQHNIRHPIEKKPVVGHEHQSAAKFEQAFLQNFQRRDIEVIGGLVEQEDVRRLQHELRDQQARPLAARKPSDRLIQPARIEHESRSPGRDVNRAVLVDHGIAIGSKRAAKRLVGIKLAILVEVDDAQGVSAGDFPRRRFDLTLQQTQQRRLAAAVLAHQAHPHSSFDGKRQISH